MTRLPLICIALLLSGIGHTARAAEAVPARAFSCFKNSLKEPLVLRLQWPDKRFAIFAWPAGKTLRVHVGVTGEVRWCWGRKVADVSGACPVKKLSWVVRNNCS